MEDRDLFQRRAELLVDAIGAHRESTERIVTALHAVVDAIEAHTAMVAAASDQDKKVALLRACYPQATWYGCTHKNTKSVNEDDGAVLFRCLDCGSGKNLFGDWLVPAAGILRQAVSAPGSSA